MPTGNFPLALLLAFIACLGLGLIAPMGAEMGRHAVAGNMHPAGLFHWAAAGFIFISVVHNVVTDFEPIRMWKWHWSGWVAFISWPVGAFALVYAIRFAPGKAAVISAIAATYPVLVSAPILWYFLSEAMSFQKVIGIFIIVIGILVAVLA